jgi:hypothetical protein
MTSPTTSSLSILPLDSIYEIRDYLLNDLLHLSGPLLRLRRETSDTNVNRSTIPSFPQMSYDGNTARYDVFVADHSLQVFTSSQRCDVKHQLSDDAAKSRASSGLGEVVSVMGLAYAGSRRAKSDVILRARTTTAHSYCHPTDLLPSLYLCCLAYVCVLHVNGREKGDNEDGSSIPRREH